MAGSPGDPAGVPAKLPPASFSGDGAAGPLRGPWQRTPAPDRDEDGSGIRPEDKKDTKPRRRSLTDLPARSRSPSLLSVYRAAKTEHQADSGAAAISSGLGSGSTQIASSNPTNLKMRKAPSSDSSRSPTSSGASESRSAK